MRPHPWIGLSDDVRLGALTEQVPPELVDEALAECGVRGWTGALSPRFMVYFTLALALFHSDSYDDVAENLVGALDGMDEAIPDKSNFTRARARLGPGALEAVFRRLAGPLAPDGLAGSFWRGMRLAAVDGFVLDTADTATRSLRIGICAARMWRNRWTDRRPPRQSARSGNTITARGGHPAGSKVRRGYAGMTNKALRVSRSALTRLTQCAVRAGLWEGR